MGSTCAAARVLVELNGVEFSWSSIDVVTHHDERISRGSWAHAVGLWSTTPRATETACSSRLLPGPEARHHTASATLERADPFDRRPDASATRPCTDLADNNLYFFDGKFRSLKYHEPHIYYQFASCGSSHTLSSWQKYHLHSGFAR